MPEPRIGYVLKMYPRFSETFVVNEILAREARGADIRIFSLRPPADPRFHATIARVQAPVAYAPRVNRSQHLWELLRGAQHLPGFRAALPELLAAGDEDAAQAAWLARAARDAGVTHLHAHFANVATTIARLAARIAGIRYSFTAHAKDLFHESVDPADVDRKIGGAHHVVTVSDFHVRHIEARYPQAAATMLRRVYNGIDLAEFPFRASRPGTDRIVAVGRLVEKKGLDDLLRAIALLREAGRAVECRIVGGGEREGSLRALASELDLGDVVTFTGPRPQDRVREEVAAANVLVAPCIVGSDGNADGLPTVLLEAMALGTPCISTDVAGIVEAIRHDETGLIVPQRDPLAIAEATARLLDDATLAARLARAARALIESEFDARLQAAQLEVLMPGRAAEPIRAEQAAPAMPVEPIIEGVA